LSIPNRKYVTDLFASFTIADGSVTTPKLADDSVTNLKIADNSISSPKLQDGSVTTEKLTNKAVTDGKLADMETNAVKCRAVAGTGVPQNLVIGSFQTLGRAATGNLKSLTRPEQRNNVGILRVSSVIDQTSWGGNQNYTKTITLSLLLIHFSTFYLNFLLIIFRIVYNDSKYNDTK
jgi:hypothetical protein